MIVLDFYSIFLCELSVSPSPFRCFLSSRNISRSCRDVNAILLFSLVFVYWDHYKKNGRKQWLFWFRAMKRNDSGSRSLGRGSGQKSCFHVFCFHVFWSVGLVKSWATFFTKRVVFMFSCFYVGKFFGFSVFTFFDQ